MEEEILENIESTHVESVSVDVTELLEELSNSSNNSESFNVTEVGESVQRMVEEVEQAETLLEEVEEVTIVEAPAIDLIPSNEALMPTDDATLRFSGASWYEQIQKETVVLAGVGGIGSYVGFLLSRLGIQQLIAYDPDRVERVNLAGQLFNSAQVNSYKVHALATNLRIFSDFRRLITMESRFNEDSRPSKIMICGFDNMQARKLFFDSWLDFVSGLPEYERKECLFIDGRLAAEEYQVFCIKGDDDFSKKEYLEKYLFSDEEAEATICSYKQTTFMANQIASTMVNLFVNFIANKAAGFDIRMVPFITEYDAGFMNFKTID